MRERLGPRVGPRVPVSPSARLTAHSPCPRRSKTQPSALAALRFVAAGSLAAVLSCPRRCQELSLRPWRAQALWTLRVDTRSCARCATRSTRSRACSTASTTSALGAYAAAPLTVASPARCASECLKAPTDPSPLEGRLAPPGQGPKCREGKALTPSTGSGGGFTQLELLSATVCRLLPIFQVWLTEAWGYWFNASYRVRGQGWGYSVSHVGT